MNSLDELITSLINNYDDVNYQLNTKQINKEEALEIIDIKNIDKNNSYVGIEFNNLKYENIISFSVNDFIVNIKVFTYSPLGEIESEKIVKRINCMIKTFSSRIEDKRINIYLFLYNCPRLIPETYNETPYEFNDIYLNDLFNCTNGYYQKRKNGIKLLITRMNCYKGLLVHELCHMCNLDFGGYDTFEEWEIDKKKYGINKFSKFTEGLNNGLSSIIHSVFIALDNEGDFKEEFNKIYYCEFKYAEELVGNLLHYFKCNKIKELKDKGYNQISMVFEYIVLRYVYLKYIDMLFHFSYEFEKREKEYYELFIKCLEIEEERDFVFNEKMIIKDTNTDVNLVRMEYYLF